MLINPPVVVLELFQNERFDNKTIIKLSQVAFGILVRFYIHLLRNDMCYQNNIET